MPQSREEMARLDAEQCLQDSTAMTATFTEAKKWQKAPRLLPIQFGLLTNLLTVYALFLEMLFTERNAHLWGLNNLCWALISMNSIHHRLSWRYLATITWAIANDTCHHFSKCMPMEDLLVKSTAMLVWLQSNLSTSAYQMMAEQEINLMMFPDEWATMLHWGEWTM